MINGGLLRDAVISAAHSISNKKKSVDELNVFPVPDGDTGTNMTLTILSAVKEVEAAPDDMKSIAKAMSTGSLRGARGNSGVILSQLLRGFSKKVQDARTIDVHVIADAFQKAGAELVGFTSTDGYTFNQSRAVRGEKFCGLVIDQENQAQLTSKRIADWCKLIKEDFTSNKKE